VRTIVDDYSTCVQRVVIQSEKLQHTIGVQLRLNRQLAHRSFLLDLVLAALDSAALPLLLLPFLLVGALPCFLGTRLALLLGLWAFFDERRFASPKLFQLGAVPADRHTDLVRILVVLEDRAFELAGGRELDTNVREVDERSDADIEPDEGAVWREEVHTEGTAPDRANPRRLRGMLVELRMLRIVGDVQLYDVTGDIVIVFHHLPQEVVEASSALDIEVLEEGEPLAGAGPGRRGCRGGSRRSFLDLPGGDGVGDDEGHRVGLEHL